MRRGLLAIALLAAWILTSCVGIKKDKLVGDTVTQITFSDFGDDKDPSVSPDGKWLLYVSSEFTENDHIYLRMIGTQTVQRITEGNFNCRHPVFNPADPQEMAFASDIQGEWDIFTCKIDSARDPSTWVNIGLRGSHDIGCSFSPDGRYVAFSTSPTKPDWGLSNYQIRVDPSTRFARSRQARSTRSLRSPAQDEPARLDSNNRQQEIVGQAQLDWYICVYDRETRRVYEFRNITGLLPKWNPHDNRILIQRMRERDNWYSGIWYFTYPSEPGQTIELVNVVSGSDWAAINPAWAPDGKRIVFAMVKPDQPAPTSTEKETDSAARSLWKIDADGTFKQLTFDPYFYWLPTWSGENIYFVSDRGGKKNIWSLKVK